MLQALFHAWERQLAAVSKDRVVRQFEWGLDWIPANGHPVPDPASPPEAIAAWVSRVMDNTDDFFTPPPTTDYELRPAAEDCSRELVFPSALSTPHPRNNTVYCRM